MKNCLEKKSKQNIRKTLDQNIPFALETCNLKLKILLNQFLQT